MTPEMLSAFLAHLGEEGLLAIEPARLAVVPGERGQSRGGVVAVIPMTGSLVPRSMRSMFGSLDGMDQLRGRIRAAAASPDVGSIVLDVDSPGGTVNGTPETADAVAAAAAVKPVVAVANTLMASAAYWIASQASEIVAGPSAEIGSIGIIGTHQNASRLYERLGIETTVVTAGKYKGELSPFAPLSDEAKAAMQSRADAAYGAFTAAVAKGRRTTEARVRSGFGEGRLVDARAALGEGMVDRIATIEEVIAGLVAGRGRVWQRRSASVFT